MAVAGAVAGMLLLAGAGKLAAPRAFRRTLGQLHVLRLERVWVAVPLVELAVAVMLLFKPGSSVTAVGLLGLGLAFAAAGARAHIRGQVINCACFGQASGGRLGLAQVAALPAWTAVAAVTWFSRPVFPADSAVLAAVVAACCLTVALLRFLPLARSARGYLLSAAH
jgi:hypothetical protein